MVQNSQEKNPIASIKREAEIKEDLHPLRCPFAASNINFKCEQCRLFIHVSKGVGRVCSINYLAMRSV